MLENSQITIRDLAETIVIEIVAVRLSLADLGLSCDSLSTDIN